MLFILLWSVILQDTLAQTDVILPPSEGPYQQRTSHFVCQEALNDFYNVPANNRICNSMPRNGPQLTTEYAWEAIQGYDAKLCSDPSLAPEYHPRRCHAVTTCKVLKGYHMCPMELLKEYFEGPLLEMICFEGLPGVVLDGVAPNNQARCVTSSAAREWQTRTMTPEQARLANDVRYDFMRLENEMRLVMSVSSSDSD